jgi:cytochrome oxidase Cu insertion factor (SCO1/SenC/PrrC family)
MRLAAILLLLNGILPSGSQAQGAQLGPKDLARLPPTDTSRVAVGAQAPDFTLEALTGPPVTLSQFRGRQNVVLVFYRGHW